MSTSMVVTCSTCGLSDVVDGTEGVLHADVKTFLEELGWEFDLQLLTASCPDEVRP